ncbi:MAG: hypothetical protein KDA89_18915 [Planctomycetaceae bacterium]|nr:hypothetical protein [Planctomycetaceae bacterium]
MGGPIVRTGTTPKFWENWDRAFGGGGKEADKKEKAPEKSAAKGKAKASSGKNRKKSGK